jgi:hypothetical protein
MMPPPLYEGKDTLAPAWIKASTRIRASGSERREEFTELAELVDLAGAQVTRLQRLYERETGVSERRDPWAQWLNFIDADVTDVMRAVSIDAACLVPGEDWLERADPVETEADVELLERYLSVASLAAEHREFPPEAREEMRGVMAALDGWAERMLAVVRRIETAYLGEHRAAQD